MKYLLCFALALGINQPFRTMAADAPASRPLDDSMADERFNDMDANRKGHITFEDFRKRYPDMQRPAFDAIDGNKDGAISLGEWRIFFQSHGAGGPMPPPGHGGGREARPLIRPPSK